MRFYADIHVHSRFSRATSRDCDLENLAFWAGKKGISVIGTGDFTHPAWFKEIKSKLAPAEPGLFKLKKSIEKEVMARLDPSCRSPVRFMLTSEISTIYKDGNKTRKVHHVLAAPTKRAVSIISRKLDRIGNIHSDGRPILGLPSRDLLEIVLESDPESYLVPAHVWTPWFSAMGSKSGYDSIDDCYKDLARHIFAIETGLSSDPPMNWMVSSLDRFTLVSNSDAHSPGKLGREANVFDTEIDYYKMKKALETGKGFLGTVEFFPEEGKYFLDGHRKCDIRMTPNQTNSKKGICPSCGKPVTVGVMNRIMQLSDRKEGRKPKTAKAFTSLIPLKEIIAEILSCGPNTKKVMKVYDHLLCKTGPELYILETASEEEIVRHGGETISLAITRMREGSVSKNPGYDGEFGVVKIFKQDEISGDCSLGMSYNLPDDEILPRSD